MSLFALITAMLLEHYQPLFKRNKLYGGVAGYADFFRQHFNAGEYHHGQLAWLLAVLPPVLSLVVILRWMSFSHPFFFWVVSTLALYLSLGFSRVSNDFDAILQTLRRGRLGEARDLLSEWRGMSCHELNSGEIARLAVEEALLASLQHVFGVLLWFGLFTLLGLGGGAGAMLYCLSLGVGRHWGGETGDDEIGVEKFDRYARRMIYLLEWLPIRLTTATFAIVGNFEDTAFCWRSQAATWPDSEKGILLAGAAGALGVRLGSPLVQDGEVWHRPELGTGQQADAGTMLDASRLIWRTTIVWLFVLLLLTLGGLLRY
ncbi:MAG: CobD/CbiB family protein [Gallionella sp.]|nr:CobD/CbiB family protein [Gallionella sp.]MDD4946323.1 CobD/CbiB family protein [Gallionella sp.]